MNIRTLSCAMAVACVCIGIGTAQEPPLEQQPKFAIEIPSDNGWPSAYVTVDGHGGFLLHDKDLHRLPNLQPNSRQPLALKLEYKAIGDEVLITAIALYGDYERDLPASASDDSQREIVGTYRGKLNDTVALSGLERVGLKPLTVRIVTVQPALPVTRQVRSNAASLTIEFAPHDRSFGTVTVHNLSNRAVSALSVGCSEDGTGGSQTVGDAGSKELISPGATYQFQAGIGTFGKMVNGVYVEDPQTRFMTLQTVLFVDGSYEGNGQLAAQIAALSIGENVQHQRIQSIAEPILADAQSTDEVKLEHLLSALDTLSVAPDPQMVATLRSRFPNLSDGEMAKSERALGWGMKSLKKNIRNSAQHYKDMARTGGGVPTFATWWDRATKE